MVRALAKTYPFQLTKKKKKISKKIIIRENITFTVIRRIDIYIEKRFKEIRNKQKGKQKNIEKLIR